MRKSTVFFSALLSLICLCLVGFLARKASRGLRRHVDLPVVSEEATEQEHSGLVDPGSSGERPAPPVSPPKLRLDFHSPRGAGSGAIGRYDSAIKSDGADPVMTDAMTSAVLAAYQGFASVIVDSVECIPGLCRLQLRGSGDAFAIEVKEGLAREVTGIGEKGFRMLAPDRAIVYVAPQNEKLPPFSL